MESFSGFSPTSNSERILSLDVLRGVAVLGILAMNIQLFAMIDSAYQLMFPTVLMIWLLTLLASSMV